MYKKKVNEKIGIVIPAANESKTIESLCNDLFKHINSLKIKSEVFIVLDRASRDNTLEILQKMASKYKSLHIIYEPKNRHLADARIKGFLEAIKQNCDFIIEMDCGFSHLPEELYKFIHGFREGYDCVFGIRPLWSLRYHVPLYRRIYSLGGTILSNLLLGTHFVDMTSGYEGFRKEVLEQILKDPILSTDHFFQTEVRFKARNFRYKEVYITYSSPTPRVKWSSVYNSFETLFFLALDNWARKIKLKK